MRSFIAILTTLLASCSTNADLLLVGADAPNFTLTSDEGETVMLTELLQKHAVILVFYPGDNTPVCTKQLCEFRDSYDDLQNLGATLVGINPSDSTSHDKFKAKNSFPFPLLIDESLAVAQSYGTAGKRTAKRAVYVIGQDGKILFVSKGKPPIEEVQAVLKK